MDNNESIKFEGINFELLTSKLPSLLINFLVYTVHPIEKFFWVLPRDLYFRIPCIKCFFRDLTARSFGSLDVE